MASSKSIEEAKEVLNKYTNDELAKILPELLDAAYKEGWEACLFFQDLDKTLEKLNVGKEGMNVSIRQG